MRLSIKPKRDDWMLVEMHRCNGDCTLMTIEDFRDFKPQFKSDDMWLAEIHTTTEEPRIEPVRIWINPEGGEIKVTLLGVPRRQPFEIVKRWIMQLNL